MFHAIEVHGQLLQERIERGFVLQAAPRRSRAPSLPIRRAVGRRFMQIGARLAAEPSLESVRSR